MIIKAEDFVQTGPTTWTHKQSSTITLHGREGQTLEEVVAEVNGDELAAMAQAKQNLPDGET